LLRVPSRAAPSQTWNVHKYFGDGAAVRSGQLIGNVLSPPPDYVKLAEAYGGRSERVEKSAGLEPAIKRRAARPCDGSLGIARRLRYAVTSNRTLIRESDTWLKDNLGAYAQWAVTHDSLLIVTWDEDDNDDSPANHIPTLMVGARLKRGQYDQRIDHYAVLRMIEDFYGLPQAGAAAMAAPIVGMIPE